MLNRRTERYNFLVKLNTIYILIILTNVPPVMGKENGLKTSMQNVAVLKYAIAIPKDSLIEERVIKRVQFRGGDIPKNAMFDRFIVLGRKTVRPVQAGDMILLEDCFTPTELRLSTKIDSIQGTRLMRANAAKLRGDNLTVKSLICRRNIPAHKTIELSDLKLRAIPVEQLRSNQALDIWTIWKRSSLRNLKEGESLYMQDIIPNAQTRK
jgi:flagella basal body P-ring formation protein FlgA